MLFPNGMQFFDRNRPKSDIFGKEGEAKRALP